MTSKLQRGCSRKTLGKNIAKLLTENEGRSRMQAISIALDEARRTGRGKCRESLGRYRKRGRASGRTSVGQTFGVDDYATLVFAYLVNNTNASEHAAEALVNKHGDIVIVDYEFWKDQSKTYRVSEVAKITAESIAKLEAAKKKKTKKP